MVGHCVPQTEGSMRFSGKSKRRNHYQSIGN